MAPLKLLLLILYPFFLFGQKGQTIALTNGTLLIGDGSPAIEKGSIRFKNGRILQLGKTDELKIPLDAIQIDVQGKTIMPGLIEGNGHITFDGQYDHGLYWTLNLPHLYEIGARNLMATLKQGVTTVRDTKGPIDVMLQLKKEVNGGNIAGSRLYTCGLILNYGGFSPLFDHIDTLRYGISGKQVRATQAALIQLTPNIEEGRKIIRSYAERGVDFIKISAFSAAVESPPSMPFEQLKAMVEEAHALGLKTTTHAMSASSVEASIDAGSDAVEHPQIISASVKGADTLISKALAQKMAKAGVYAVPLMVAGDVYVKYYSQPDLLNTDPLLKEVPKERLEKDREDIFNLLMRRPNIAEGMKARVPMKNLNLKNLIEAGVPIAMGTDRGTRLNYHQSANHVREMEIYIELGMSPMEAIKAATLNGAELLGMEAHLGSLEVGKIADIIVIDGNPLEDIQALHQVKMVFKEGIRFK